MLPTIETVRLILRDWRDDDLAPWYEMNADPRVMEFFVSTYDRERADRVAESIRAANERNGYGWWVLEIKGSEGFAGVVALDDMTIETLFTPAREIGWRLPVKAWRRGYATEGAQALMNHARTLNWNEVFSMTSLLNHRSERVMQRLGMERDASLDFDHPRIPESHRLRRHVVYRKKIR